MKATLYAAPASHPSLAAELMLEHKGIQVRRIDLVTALHRAFVRALGFPGTTVPAVKLDGQRLQGTRTISRALDALVPERPLFPADPARRTAVEQAESWGDDVLQPAARRLVWAGLKRDRSTLGSYLEGARLGLPTRLAVATSPPIVALSARLNRADEPAIRRDLAELPGMIDHVDELLREGTIGGDERNAADYQIGTSVRLLSTLDDLRPLLDGRPAAAHASAVAPRYPGRLGPVFPRDLLPA